MFMLSHEELKQLVLDKLRTVTELIEREEYEEVANDHISMSLSGDDDENFFIDFSDDAFVDIGEVLDELIGLKERENENLDN